MNLAVAFVVFMDWVVIPVVKDAGLVSGCRGGEEGHDWLTTSLRGAWPKKF